MVSIKIPEGMLKAAMDAWDSCGHVVSHRVDADYYKRRFLEAALRWLIDELHDRPTPVAHLIDENSQSGTYARGYTNAVADIRRMFLADPEPEVPEEVRDLVEGMSWESSTWKLIIEAFRRGRQAGLDIGFPPIKKEKS